MARATTEAIQREAARVQSLFRDVNDRIKDLVTADAPDFLCECADVECIALLPIPVDEYERARRNPTWFFVKPEHVLAPAERIAETRKTYVVVEKIGAGGPLAAELDPRRRA